MGHVLMENRHGLVVEAALTRAAASPSGWQQWRWWQGVADRGR